MKIASIKAHAASIPLRVPRITAHEPMPAPHIILVEVKTDDGVTGIGQIHGGPAKDICMWVERFGEIVRGMDALAHVEVWEKLFLLTRPRPSGMFAKDGLPGPLPRLARPQIMAAIGGIDIALWDIKGKAAGLPVYRLLGAQNRPIPVYATGGYYIEGEPLDACAKEMASYVSDKGYRAVKLKVGGLAMKDDVTRVRLTREAIGKDIMLLLDLSAAYTIEEGIEFAREVEPYGVFWLEEPLHWYLQPADFKILANATLIPLAHCERELTRFTVRDYITSGGVRYVQFDSTRHAGFTEALRVAYLAEQLGARIAPHQVPELHAHLCAAFPNASFGCESSGTPDPMWAGMYKHRADLSNGYVRMDDKPGFGIEIDWDFINRHRVQ
jgi:L-alanine-DL-glutamate epimerase-like enolase superfamily enzyme